MGVSHGLALSHMSGYVRKDVPTGLGQRGYPFGSFGRALDSQSSNSGSNPRVIGMILSFNGAQRVFELFPVVCSR